MQLYTKTKKSHYPLPVFGKLFTAFMLFLAAFAINSGYSCEKHKSSHQIIFGNPEAKIAVTQHFSLGSPEFLRFAKEEFPVLKADFIDTGFVSWTFCPHVADLATIQLVSCLETLSSSQKPEFFSRVLLEISPRVFAEMPHILTKALKGLSVSEKKLELLQLLKLGEVYNLAGDFGNQKVFAKPPFYIEIGDCIFDRLIHPDAIRYQIQQQL